MTDRFGPSFSALVRKIQNLEVLPLPGFTGQEAGHAVDPGHDLPFRAHFLSVRVGIAGYELSLGGSGAVNVSLPDHIRRMWLTMPPYQRESFLRRAVMQWNRQNAKVFALRLWSADLATQWNAAQARFEHLIDPDRRRETI